MMVNAVAISELLYCKISISTTAGAGAGACVAAAGTDSVRVGEWGERLRMRLEAGEDTGVLLLLLVEES